MRELGDAVQETVVVGILTPAIETRVIEKAKSPRQVRYEIEVGVPYPAYCTAIGRTILAFSDPGLVEHYLRTVTMTKCTENTVTDPAAIREILSVVRKQGYAINIEEHVQGASSVAAPLLTDRSEVVAALNVGCVTAHFFNNRENIISLLVATASRLSKRLGDWN